jgi:hypothetical protein
MAINFLVRAARALLCPSSLELGGVGIYDSENRRIFSDLSQISTTLEHGSTSEQGERAQNHRQQGG